MPEGRRATNCARLQPQASRARRSSSPSARASALSVTSPAPPCTIQTPLVPPRPGTREPRQLRNNAPQASLGYAKSAIQLVAKVENPLQWVRYLHVAHADGLGLPSEAA